MQNDLLKTTTWLLTGVSAGIFLTFFNDQRPFDSGLNTAVEATFDDSRQDTATIKYLPDRVETPAVIATSSLPADIGKENSVVAEDEKPSIAPKQPPLQTDLDVINKAPIGSPNKAALLEQAVDRNLKKALVLLERARTQRRD
jgi:hypothetical protein